VNRLLKATSTGPDTCDVTRRVLKIIADNQKKDISLVTTEKLV